MGAIFFDRPDYWTKVLVHPVTWVAIEQVKQHELQQQSHVQVIRSASGGAGKSPSMPAKSSTAMAVESGFGMPFSSKNSASSCGVLMC
ncbi:hypothetical protein CBI38_34125 (plasmid) [Rhodococcus oxybenzonivorans]|uniref:Uncharacterized protein n=1 Tax=Rhodococcus oxybenzonivorans TaxID=1990687 RepID=A0A2S2C6K1_9NOCA|nr:hypothetical protein CBI38_34125 [Rhodococcus oxybenzonivorans]